MMWRNILILLLACSAIFAVYKLFGPGLMVCFCVLLYLVFYVRDSHSKLSALIIKVHKNNIENQKSLMKEIKRGNDVKKT